MKPRAAEADPCPCGLPADYAACCGRYIGPDALPAPDAERLMRSRYSAFVRQRADHLLATWHSRCRPSALNFDAGAQWLGLQVRRASQTGADAAEVEFVARYRLNGRAVRLHEVSRFVREGGLWFYLTGDVRA